MTETTPMAIASRPRQSNDFEMDMEGTLLERSGPEGPNDIPR
jgi:hypothetical protein